MARTLNGIDATHFRRKCKYQIYQNKTKKNKKIIVAIVVFNIRHADVNAIEHEQYRSLNN